MPTLACPDHRSLAAYAVGNVPPEQLDEIARHLGDCPGCLQTLETLLPAADTLVAALRAPPLSSPFLAEAECRAALEEIARLCPAPNSPAAVSAPLGSIREYELLAEIGHGGMGTVYRALHTHLNRIVALKVLPPERLADPQAVARFRQEMRVVGQLDHPHIVRAFDAGQHESTHYLVLEFADGIDLSTLAQRIGPLPIADACELVRQAAEGLEYAHRRQLVHRDIKPSNLLLTLDGQLKILDFGLALLWGDQKPHEELTSTGQVMGTVDYMAPEQIQDTHGVDIRADLYSLGCTLFKLLTGSAPFSGPQYRTSYQKMQGHVQDASAPIGQLRPDVPETLAALVARLLSKDPAARFATPGELAQALAPFAGGADLPGLAQRAADPAAPPATPVALTQTSLSSAAETDPNAHSPASTPTVLAPAPTAPSRRRWLTVAAAAALMLLGVVIYLQTGEGTVEVTINEPDAKIEIDGREPKLVVDAPGGKLTITVPAGRRELLVSKPGFEAETQRFRLVRGGKVSLEVVLKPLGELVQAAPAVVKPKPADEPATASPTNEAPWPLGPVDGVLPGLLPRPTAIPGIPAWQVETVAPRGVVKHVQWNAAGTRLAVIDLSKYLRIYRFRDEKLELESLTLMPKDRILHTFAWAPQGELLAICTGSTVTNTGSFLVLNCASGQLTTLQDDSRSTDALTWNPNSKEIAVIDGRKLRFLGLDGTSSTSPECLDAPGYSVSWQPGGDKIVVIDEKALLKVVNRAGQVQYQFALKAIQGSPGNNACWNADGTTFACMEPLKTHVWEATFRDPPRTLDRAGHGSLSQIQIAFLPGAEVVVGAFDGLEFWHWRDSERQYLAAPRTRVGRTDSHVALHPSGTLLARTSDGVIDLWKMGENDPFETVGVLSTVCDAEFAPDSAQLATCQHDFTVRFWKRDGRRAGVVAGRHPVDDLSWLPSGQQVLATGKYTDASLVDVRRQTAQPVSLQANHRHEMNPAAPLVAIIHEDRPALFDLQAGSRTSLGPGGFSDGHFAWSPDGKQLALAGRDDKAIRVIDVETQAELWRGPELKSRVLSIDWSPDGKSILIFGLGQNGHEIVVLEAGGGQIRWQREPPNRYFAMSFSRDGRQVLGVWETEMHSFDAATGDLRKSVVRDTHKEIDRFFPERMNWSRDGRQFVLSGAGAAGLFQVWNAARLEPEWVGLPVSPTKSVAFTAAGQMIDPEPDAEQLVVWVVPREDGTLELLSRPEFLARKRAAEVGEPAPTPVAPTPAAAKPPRQPAPPGTTSTRPTSPPPSASPTSRKGWWRCWGNIAGGGIFPVNRRCHLTGHSLP